MKKTFIALALAASIAPAWAAEVVSSNIVGYQKLSLVNGFTMIGTAFQTVGSNGQISVQEIKGSGLTGVDWSFETEAGDTLMIWSPDDQGYMTEFLYTGDTENADMLGNGAKPGTWFDMGTYATADYTLKNGDAFWIVSSSPSASVTIAGEVPTSANSISLVPGFNMIANPFPVSVKVNDLFTATGLTGVDWTFETEAGDSLMIWDPSEQGYMTELLYSGDVATEAMTENGAKPGTWFDMGAYATAEVEIPVGGAFWIVSSGSGTLTFKNPFSNE